MGPWHPVSEQSEAAFRRGVLWEHGAGTSLGMSIPDQRWQGEVWRKQVLNIPHDLLGAQGLLDLTRKCHALSPAFLQSASLQGFSLGTEKLCRLVSAAPGKQVAPFSPTAMNSPALAPEMQMNHRILLL